MKDTENIIYTYIFQVIIQINIHIYKYSILFPYAYVVFQLIFLFPSELLPLSEFPLILTGKQQNTSFVRKHATIVPEEEEFDKS